MTQSFDAFAQGDYLSAVRQFTPDQWQHWAGLGLMGHPTDSGEALTRFTDPQAAFYSGVASWIRGDEDRALHVLKRCRSEHARRLAALIERRPIIVLAQLPWNRRGAWDIVTSLNDPAFRLLNVSFHPDDIQNRPYADVNSLLPDGVRPDFFVAAMLEWHLLPPNVRSLGCPVIGHSSDFDLHIQTVAPWMELFDELVVLDDLQWRDIQRLARVPVSVFPKAFGVPSQLPCVPDGERDVSVFLSGTVTHPYHPDKEATIVDALRIPSARLLIVDGFEPVDSYYCNLSRAKVCCTFVRHPGAMPTRGLEALGMGCAVVVQEESALRLFVDDAAGVVPYGRTSRSLTVAIQDVLARWDEYRVRARAGADIVRREFALTRVASQYLRFLTVLASRPRAARAGPPPDQMLQKRAVVHKGWLPSYTFGSGLLMDWAAESAARIERRLSAGESPRLLNDLARERLLAHYHDPRSLAPPPWLDGVAEPLERAIDRFPRALVPRLNLARVFLHFGEPEHVRRGVALVDETLDQPADRWEIDLLDDVLPWDFCPSFFNYRRYFDVVMRSFASPESAAPELTAVILASLTHYRARYADEIPGQPGALAWAAESVRLDPDFTEYVLYYCRLLIARGQHADAVQVRSQLQRLARRSTRLIEIHDLARRLPPDLQGAWYTELEQLAARFWASTERHDYLVEPVPRSSRSTRGVGPAAACSRSPAIA